MEKFPGSEPPASEEIESVSVRETANGARVEKREALYDELRERIGTITELRGELEREDIKGGEFVRNAEAKIDGILEGCRESAASKSDEKEHLIRQSEEIDAAIANSDYDFLSPEVQKLSAENDGIRGRIAEIDDDPDVRLFGILNGAKASLRYKARRYEDFKKDPAAIKMPKRISGFNVSATERETVFSNLSISFLLDDSEMDDLKYDNLTVGIHFEGDVFNIVRRSEDPEDDVESIRHENTHSVYEAFDDRPRTDIAKRKNVSDELNRFLQAIDTGSEAVRKMQFNGLVKRAKRVVFSSKGELIANFERLKIGKLNTELAAFYEIKGYLKEVGRSLSSPSNKRSGESKKIAAEYIDLYLLELQKEFDSFYSLLGDLFFVAEHEGKMEELKSAMILFNTDEYRKIVRHFRHETGEEKYGFYEALRRFTREKFFNIPGRKIDEVVKDEAENIFDAQDVMKITAAVKADPGLLTPEIKQEILLSLDSLESRPSYIAATASGVSECEDAYRVMVALAEVVGSGREYAESAVENLLNSALLDAIDGDLAKLNDVLVDLGPEHDGVILRFVENYIKNESADDFESADNLKSSPLWRALVGNGRTRDAALRAVS